MKFLPGFLAISRAWIRSTSSCDFCVMLLPSKKQVRWGKSSWSRLFLVSFLKPQIQASWQSQINLFPGTGKICKVIQQKIIQKANVRGTFDTKNIIRGMVNIVTRSRLTPSIRHLWMQISRLEVNYEIFGLLASLVIMPVFFSFL